MTSSRGRWSGGAARPGRERRRGPRPGGYGPTLLPGGPLLLTPVPPVLPGTLVPGSADAESRRAADDRPEPDEAPEQPAAKRAAMSKPAVHVLIAVPPGRRANHHRPHGTLPGQISFRDTAQRSAHHFRPVS